MSHFAAFLDVGLAIEVNSAIRLAGASGDGVDIFADEVFHHHVRMAAAIPQGPARDGADVLLELIDGTAVLGPMNNAFVLTALDCGIR